MTEQMAAVVERTISAPMSLVWKMWTDAEHFAAWYGPQGARIPVAEMDVQLGGRRFITMEMDTPEGTMSMHFVGTYTEIDPESRLVYTEAMADESGESTSPFTDVIVELSETDGATKVVVTHVGIPADSPGAMGWQMALDKLATRAEAAV